MCAYGFLDSWLSLDLQAPAEHWPCWARAGDAPQSRGQERLKPCSQAAAGRTRPGGRAAVWVKPSRRGWRESHPHRQQSREDQEGGG